MQVADQVMHEMLVDALAAHPSRSRVLRGSSDAIGSSARMMSGLLRPRPRDRDALLLPPESWSDALRRQRFHVELLQRRHRNGRYLFGQSWGHDRHDRHFPEEAPHQHIGQDIQTADEI